LTNRWPWPAETPLDRARAIANSLLALLPTSEQPIWAERAHAVGETWLGESLVTHQLDDAITGSQAAALVHVSQDTIRQWATRPHPEQPERKLLPRFKKSGRSRTT
jgi:hypothetical protein